MIDFPHSIKKRFVVFGKGLVSLSLALVFCLVVRTVNAQDFTAKCVGVTDGDTITVLVGQEQMRIRLEGIDTPERGQDFSLRGEI